MLEGADLGTPKKAISADRGPVTVDGDNGHSGAGGSPSARALASFPACIPHPTQASSANGQSGRHPVEIAGAEVENDLRLLVEGGVKNEAHPSEASDSPHVTHLDSGSRVGRRTRKRNPLSVTPVAVGPETFILSGEAVDSPSGSGNVGMGLRRASMSVNTLPSTSPKNNNNGKAQSADQGSELIEALPPPTRTYSITTMITLFISLLTIGCCAAMFLPPFAISIDSTKANVAARQATTMLMTQRRIQDFFQAAEGAATFTANFIQRHGMGAGNFTLLAYQELLCQQLVAAPSYIDKIYLGFERMDNAPCCARNGSGLFVIGSNTPPYGATHRVVALPHWPEDTLLLDASPIENSSYFATSRPWYQDGFAAAAGVWSALYVDFGGRSPAFSFTTPFFMRNGSVAGLAAVDLTVGYLKSYIVGLGTDSAAVVIFDTLSGEVLATSCEAVPLVLSVNGTLQLLAVESVPLPLLQGAVSSAPASVRSAPVPLAWSFGNVFEDRGTARLAALNLSTLNGPSLRMIMVVADKDFNHDVMRSFKICLAFFVIAVVCFPVAGAVGSHILVARPLRALRVELDGLASLNFTGRASDSSGAGRPQSQLSTLEEIQDIQRSARASALAVHGLSAFVPMSLWSSLLPEGRQSQTQGDGLTAQTSTKAVSQAAKFLEEELESIDSDMSDEEYEQAVKHAISAPSSANLRHSSSFQGTGALEPPSASALDRSTPNRTSVMAVPKVPSRVLRRQVATIMVLNLRNYNALCLKMNEAQIAVQHARIVEFISRAVLSHRGNIDYFYGDHFVSSFNSVTPMASHRKQAVLCALNIRDQVDTLQREMDREGAATTSPIARPLGIGLVRTQSTPPAEGGLSLSCGIASGRCVVGNMGPEMMLRFCCIGDCVGHAFQLERACNTAARSLLGLPTPIPVPLDPQSSRVVSYDGRNRFNIFTLDSIVPDIAAEVYYQCVDTITLYPQTKRSLVGASYSVGKEASLNGSRDSDSPSSHSLVTLNTLTRSVVARGLRDQIVVAPMEVIVASGQGTGNEEWMYKLQQREQQDPYQYLNKAFAEVCFGDWRAGLQLLQRQLGKDELYATQRLLALVRQREHFSVTPRNSSRSSANP